MRNALTILFSLIALGCSDNRDASTPGSVALSYLYVVQGGAGSATAAGDRWLVSMNVAGGRMLKFSDRPNRVAAHIDTADFIAGWADAGFADVPPNAALTGTASDGTAVDVAMEITSPAWDDATQTLTFTARGIGSDAMATLPANFSQLSLFIDSSLPSVIITIANVAGTALRLTSITPDLSSWWPLGPAPALGEPISLLVLSPLTWMPNKPTEASFHLTGDAGNDWWLSFSWDGTESHGVISKKGGSGIYLSRNSNIQVNVPVDLDSLNNVKSTSEGVARYRILFTFDPML